MATSSRKFWKTGIDSGTGLVGPLLILLLIAVPVVWSVGYSVLYSVGAIGYLAHGLTLEHWRTALRGGGVTSSILFSAVIASTVTAISTSVSLAVVLTIPEIRRHRPLMALLKLPVATPVSVVGFLVLQLLSAGGLFARVGAQMGFLKSPAEFPSLVQDRWAFGILIAHSFTAIPLLALYFAQLWTTVCAERYCRLAESLGASPKQARFRVALPLLLLRGKPLIALMFLWTFGSYEIPLLLGRQFPQMISVMAARRSGLYDLSQRPLLFVLATAYFVLVGSFVAFCLWRRKPYV